MPLSSVTQGDYNKFYILNGLFVTEKELILPWNAVRGPYIGVTSFLNVAEVRNCAVSLFIVDDGRNYKEMGTEFGTLCWRCLCECITRFVPSEVLQSVVLVPHTRRQSSGLLCHCVSM
jgi:hypothetical protein